MAAESEERPGTPNTIKRYDTYDVDATFKVSSDDKSLQTEKKFDPSEYSVPYYQWKDCKKGVEKMIETGKFLGYFIRDKSVEFLVEFNVSEPIRIFNRSDPSA